MPRISGFLHSPRSEGKQHAITVTFAKPSATTLRLRVAEVFGHAHLVVTANGGNSIFDRAFTTGPSGQGEWKSSKYHEQWKTYQCAYDHDYVAKLPSGTRDITVANTNGTWISLSLITIEYPDGPNTRSATLPLQSDWSASPAPSVRFDASRAPAAFSGIPMFDASTLWDKYVGPFVALRDSGVGVVVGEFGCFNKTPHPIALAWLEDCLKNWRRAGFGWAMWNFRGPFGVLDSDRADVAYEDFRGHKLDRKMLELLLSYRQP
jgi:hypothetical protein